MNATGEPIAESMGVAASPPGHQPSWPQPATQSSQSGVPNAELQLRERERLLAAMSLKIRAATDSARALAWLDRYAERALTYDDIRIEVSTNMASKCDGYIEAMGLVERALRGLIVVARENAAGVANAQVADALASGIEGEAGDPKGLHPEGESPVPKADAQGLEHDPQ